MAFSAGGDGVGNNPNVRVRGSGGLYADGPRDLETRLLVRRYGVRIALDLGINPYMARHREKLPT